MEGAKPIIPGCLAYEIIDWTQCEVVDVASISKWGDSDPYWQVIPARPETWPTPVTGGKFAVLQSKLIRIDDPFIQKQIESEKEKEIA